MELLSGVERLLFKQFSSIFGSQRLRQAGTHGRTTASVRVRQIFGIFLILIAGTIGILLAGAGIAKELSDSPFCRICDHARVDWLSHVPSQFHLMPDPTHTVGSVIN